MYDTWLDQHRTSRDRTLELVRGMSQDQLDFRPAKDQWSIGEVLDHLALAEERVRRELECVIQQLQAGGPAVRHLTFQDLECAPAFLPMRFWSLLERPVGWINRTIVSNRFRDFITRKRLFRIRHPSSAEPRYGLPAGTHDDQLVNSFDALARLFDAAHDLDLSQVRIVHPLLGSKDVVDMIRFAIAHEERHRNQIIRVSQAFNLQRRASINPERVEHVA